jgi:hypothetical protein
MSFVAGRKKRSPGFGGREKSIAHYLVGRFFGQWIPLSGTDGPTLPEGKLWMFANQLGNNTEELPCLHGMVRR